MWYLRYTPGAKKKHQLKLWKCKKVGTLVNSNISMLVHVTVTNVLHEYVNKGKWVQDI